MTQSLGCNVGPWFNRNHNLNNQTNGGYAIMKAKTIDNTYNYLQPSSSTPWTPSASSSSSSSSPPSTSPLSWPPTYLLGNCSPGCYCLTSKIWFVHAKYKLLSHIEPQSELSVRVTCFEQLYNQYDIVTTTLQLLSSQTIVVLAQSYCELIIRVIMKPLDMTTILPITGSIFRIIIRSSPFSCWKQTFHAVTISFFSSLA